MLTDNLIKLAKIFHKTPLYLVGGYVRDFLLQINTLDVDITSSLEATEVIKLLEGTGYKTTIINKKLGTVLITIDNEKYEYTAFRSENYSLKGEHSPVNTKFDVSIKEDSERRDFTINAIYYDILQNQFVDLVGGKNDLENRNLKTVKQPDLTFMEDSLRILRLARFCIVYNLKIEDETYISAKKNSYLVKNLSRERVIEEYKKTISKCDYFMMLDYVELLFDLGVFNSLYGKNISYSRYKTADGFQNFCPKIEYFYLAFIERFYYNFDKDYSIDSFNDIVKAEKDIFKYVDSIIKEDKLPNITAKNIKQLVAFTVLLYKFKNKSRLDILVSHYYNIITNIFSSKQNRMMIKNPIINNLARFLNYDKPTNVSMLALSGLDLQNIGVKPCDTSKVLTLLLEAVLLDKVENDKTKLLKYWEEL